MKKDKALHLFWSFWIALIATSFHPKWGFVIALGFGVLKEGIDSIQKAHLWSWSDIGFDLLGIGIAWAVYLYAEQYGYIATVASAVARYFPWL
jgi:uncharacterized protein YfiM (DUF2279 family)